MFPRVGISMVQILEQLGHTGRISGGTHLLRPAGVQFRLLGRSARRWRCPCCSGLKNAEAVVIASGSCGAMMKVFYPQTVRGHRTRGGRQGAVREVLRIFRFSRHQIGRDRSRRAVSGARSPFTTAATACANWATKSRARDLLAKVRELELVEMSDAETCCGFGGTFAAKFPMISTAMGEVKCASAAETGAEYIVSNDSSCLMHVQGLLDRQGKKIKTHSPRAEVLGHERHRMSFNSKSVFIVSIVVIPQ